MNPVAPRFGAEIDHGISNAGRRATEDLVFLGNPQTKHIDQRIERIDVVEDDLPPDSRHSHAIAVAGNTGDNPLHQVAIFR